MEYPEKKYFIKFEDVTDWIEVTKGQFIKTERQCGFSPVSGSKEECATAGFGCGMISGRIEYVKIKID
jgi:hypothetical protein